MKKLLIIFIFPLIISNVEKGNYTVLINLRKPWVQKKLKDNHIQRFRNIGIKDGDSANKLRGSVEPVEYKHVASRFGKRD